MSTKITKDIYRIIDANLNRSREGLRVCEEIARFVLKSPSLTRELKTIRHRISDVARVRPVGQSVLSESRDSDRDVGKWSAK
jgi:thiamine-phosphate pyrophosphorylase